MEPFGRKPDLWWPIQMVPLVSPKTVLPERLVTWRHQWNHLDGPPQVRLASNLEAEESRRSNPDDCEWKFIERNVFSYHGRIEPEAALPKVVAYDRDRLRT